MTVVAKHLPGDEAIEYTSPWAGAHWRPHGSADDQEQADWDMQTYNHWKDLIEEEKQHMNDIAHRSGIVVRFRFLAKHNNC